ncbi:MAG: branched-chain amino acid ABC transporter permease [Candidatus Schekmanbacteria bacterium]|nr:branched-chain amino acid ABC transporter permease [Candidatus Schekmanbacteria bacterium]
MEITPTTLFLRQAANAATLGAVYALIAVGYTMVYGIAQLINFAHGEIYMLGAFLGILFIGAGMSFPVAMLLSMASCAAVGVAVDRVAYRPLRSSPRLAPLITAIAVSLILQNVAMLVWGAEQRPFPDLRPEVEYAMPQAASADSNGEWVAGRRWLEAFDAALRNRIAAGVERRSAGTPVLPEATLRLLAENGELVGLRVSFASGTKIAASRPTLQAASQEACRVVGIPARPGIIAESRLVHWLEAPAFSVLRAVVTWKVVLIWVITSVMMLVLELIVLKTRLGRAMRACALDRTTAALMGVNVNAVIACAFAIGSAMAAVAGLLYGLYLGSGIYFRMGTYAGVVAFAAAVLGGIGNLRGAMLGGLLLGIVQVFTKAYVTDWLGIDSSYDIAFAFLVLILVILVRPSGLLGTPGAERA